MENCLQRCEKDGGLKIAEKRIETVKAFYEYFKNRGNSVDRAAPTAGAAADNKTPLKILSKPRANYTDAARQAGAQGTITLAVVFSSDAKIRHVMVLKGLGYGLDREALRAALNIGFEPATENGKPITVVKQVQYSFAIY